ncbi:MAG TPA: Wzz/FepE/Etk N-terminal domain-containing protein [Chloroflexota bacterium]|nr:Wzz/FepE/Etk N-terminal domain-containing protein [Chloroflexota bacterium]
MQFRDYWLVFSKRWWLVVLVAFAACVASYGYAKLQTPMYRADVQLLVTPSRLDYGLTLVIDNTLTQYQLQLLTRTLATQVDQDLKLDLPVEKLLSRVHVSADTNGYLLDITVDDPDPNNAQAIARDWAEKFIEQQQAAMAQADPTDRTNIQELDPPLPGVLVFPKTKQYVLAAGVLGLVVGTALAFLLEYLDDTLRTPEDVERFVGLPLVGSIPTATEITLPHPNGRAKVGVTEGHQ